MNAFSQIDVNSLTAIDVHVHLEPLNDASPTDAAARKYFGDSGASRDHKALAEYYRSRKIAFVIFAVDERLTGRTHVSNDEVIRLGATLNAMLARLETSFGATSISRAASHPRYSSSRGTTSSWAAI